MSSTQTSTTLTARTPFDWHTAARALLPVIVEAIIWFLLAPSGLTPKAWRMFAVFVATIAGIVTAPLPM